MLQRETNYFAKFNKSKKQYHELFVNSLIFVTFSKVLYLIFFSFSILNINNFDNENNHYKLECQILFIIYY